MPNSIKSYQRELAVQFSRLYGSRVQVETEWQAITNIRGLYSPRIDVAVGPFSTIRGGNCIMQYNEMMDSSRTFIERLLHKHADNMRQLELPAGEYGSVRYEELLNFNENARCLFAVEIENKVSRKHLLGGALNACALGRMGIVVGWTAEKMRALFKLQAYWDFLESVGKNTFRAKNLIVIDPHQLVAAFRD